MAPIQTWRRFKDWPIRRKLLAAFVVVFSLLSLISTAITRHLVARVTHRELESKLETTTAALENLIRASVESSITSYLRGIAERNADTVAAFHQYVAEGHATKPSAIAQLRQILLKQKIGLTGYTFVMDTEGRIIMHPDPSLEGRNVGSLKTVKDALAKGSGTYSYRWSNPGDATERAKLLHGVRFEPWGWIICSNAYLDEFHSIVNVQEFRRRVLEVKYGQTGYPFIIDIKGNVLIHPYMEGQNVLNVQASDGRAFMKEMIAQRNGRIVYPWRSLDDTRMQEKVVVFRELPEMGWILASSCYLAEFQQPEKVFAGIFAASLLVSILLSMGAAYWLSRFLAHPLIRLSNHVQHAIEGRLEPFPIDSHDEVGLLALAFNGFIRDTEEHRLNLEASEHRLRALFEQAAEGIFRSTREGRYLDANASMARMLGYDTPAELIAAVSNIEHQVYLDPSPRKTLWTQLESEGMVRGFRLDLKRRDGRVIHTIINARAVPDERGQWDMEGFLRDITEEVRANETVLAHQQELEDRVEARTQELREGILNLERHNREFADLQEFMELLQVCQNLQEVPPVLQAFMPRLFPDMEGYVHFQEGSSGILVTIAHSRCAAPSEPFPQEACWALRSGKPYWMQAGEGKPACNHGHCPPDWDRICVPLAAGGEFHGLLEIHNHETQNREHLSDLACNVAERLSLALTTLKLRISLREQSIRDPLTGLFNRRFLEEVGSRQLRLAERGHQPLSLMLFDIDHFKQFNDIHGHDAGDAVLCQLARFVRNRLRATDLAFRFGGEEFLLLLPNSNLQGAAQRAESLRLAVAEELCIEHGDATLHITISLGVSTFPEHGQALDELIKNADLAMYEAKRRGRNQVQCAQ